MCLQVQIAVPESVGPAKEDGGPANPALHREDQPVLGVGAAGRQGDGHHVGQGRLQDVKGHHQLCTYVSLSEILSVQNLICIFSLTLPTTQHFSHLEKLMKICNLKLDDS